MARMRGVAKFWQEIALGGWKRENMKGFESHDALMSKAISVTTIQ